MVENTFQTRHAGLAGCLRYILGDEAHLATYLEGRSERVSYLFFDPDHQCRRLSDIFFSQDAPMQIGDARGLLESMRLVRKTLSACSNSETKRWDNPLLRRFMEAEDECPTI